MKCLLCKLHRIQIPRKMDAVAITSVIPVCLHLGIGRQRQENCLQLTGQLVTYEVVNKRDPISSKVDGKDQI